MAAASRALEACSPDERSVSNSAFSKLELIFFDFSIASNFSFIVDRFIFFTAFLTKISQFFDPGIEPFTKSKLFSMFVFIFSERIF